MDRAGCLCQGAGTCLQAGSAAERCLSALQRAFCNANPQAPTPGTSQSSASLVTRDETGRTWDDGGWDSWKEQLNLGSTEAAERQGLRVSGANSANTERSSSVRPGRAGMISIQRSASSAWGFTHFYVN